MDFSRIWEARELADGKTDDMFLKAESGVYHVRSSFPANDTLNHGRSTDVTG
jgi:hypothetical protein